MLLSCAAKGCNRADGTVQELTLSSIQHLPSLQPLVEAALPPGTPLCRLRSLSIFHSRLPLPAVLSCPFLGHLTGLVLSICRFPDGGAAPAVEALLQQAPRLQSLTLQACFQKQPFPPALVNRTGLLHLSLVNNDIAELPPGSYLESELTWCLMCGGAGCIMVRAVCMAGMPAGLIAAVACTALQECMPPALPVNHPAAPFRPPTPHCVQACCRWTSAGTAGTRCRQRWLPPPGSQNCHWRTTIALC